jgi:hypothetical protein
MGGAKKNRCRVVRPASPQGEDPVGAYFSFGERRGGASRLPRQARVSAVSMKRLRRLSKKSLLLTLCYLALGRLSTGLDLANPSSLILANASS